VLLHRTPGPTTLGMIWYEAQQGGPRSEVLVECRHLRDAKHAMEQRDARAPETRPRVHSIRDADVVFDASEAVTL